MLLGLVGSESTPRTRRELTGDEQHRRICQSLPTGCQAGARQLVPEASGPRAILRGRLFVVEYGDEVWKGADKDIENLIDSIMFKDELADIDDYSIEFLVRCDPAYPMAFSRNWFSDELLDRLVAYHRQQAAHSRTLTQCPGWSSSNGSLRRSSKQASLLCCRPNAPATKAR